MVTNQKLEYFITGVTLVSVLLIIIQSVLQLKGNALLAIYIFDFITVVILAVEFYYRMRQSKEPAKFLLRHSYEFLGMIPLFVFGILETQAFLTGSFRLLRVVRLFRLIQLYSRVMSLFKGVQSRIFYTIILSSIMFTAAAVAMYYVEGDVKGSKITSLGDAFWWAIATVATVPYGDVYPVTPEGRIIAGFFMIAGVAILWVLITTVGGNMIESRIRSKLEVESTRKTQEEEKLETLQIITKEELDSLVASINNLRTEVLTILTIVSGLNLICNVCKHSNPNGSLFCNSCGSSMESILADTKIEQPAKGLSKDKELGT